MAGCGAHVPPREAGDFGLKPRLRGRALSRAIADRLLTWYNTDHRHSQIRYVTPQERHEGRDVAILAQRQQVYADARQRHPQRWSAGTRNWSRTEQVTLNPHRVEQVQSPKR